MKLILMIYLLWCSAVSFGAGEPVKELTNYIKLNQLVSCSRCGETISVQGTIYSGDTFYQRDKDSCLRKAPTERICEDCAEKLRAFMFWGSLGLALGIIIYKVRIC